MNDTPLLPDLLQDGIHPIDYDTAMFYVTRFHYLRRACPCSNAFGLFRDGRIVGVVVYGTPSSAPLRSGICGPQHADDVVELCRLWIEDGQPKNSASHLIGGTIKWCGKPIVVSFADTSQGHLGIVYQAANWIYTGLSAKRTNWTIEGQNKHCQTIADKWTAAQLRETYGAAFSLKDRPRKHRYVYFNCDKRTRRVLLARLRYPVLPYPKKSGEGGKIGKNNP